MNGVHDLGGMEGFGAVDPPAKEPVFYSDWERRVFSMFLPFGFAGLNLDQFRYGIEQLHPVEYLAGRYYEHWLHTIEHGLIEKGVISEEELEERTRRFRENPNADLPDGGDADQADTFIGIYKAGASTRRPDEAREPRFAVGDRVRVRNMNPHGHTRCQRYLRGKEGVITEVYDAFVLPDTNYKEAGENPQRVYNVRFTAEEVWGPSDGGERHAIHTDLWEPYLEPAA